MLIIADTGPLISLIQIGNLDVLRTMHPDFIVPRQVFDELLRYQPLQKFKSELNSLLKHTKMPAKMHHTSEDLDLGEQACVALYYEYGAEAILIEDKAARAWAEKHGITCFGTIALLLRAKQKGLITAIKPSLLLMKANKRFISPELFSKALRDAGEQL